MLKKSCFLSVCMLTIMFSIVSVASAATSNGVNTQRTGITSSSAIEVAVTVDNDPVTSVDHETKKVDETTKLRVQESYGKLPLTLIKNNGQLNNRVKYYERGSGHSTYFTEEGVYLSLTGSKPAEEYVKNKKDKDVHTPHPLKEDINTDTRYTETIKLIPINANKDAEIIAEGIQKSKVNYLIGNDPAKWNTNIPTYQSVTYRKVYDGIDIKFYGNNSQMEYDIIIKPGASPAKVKLQYDGVEELNVNEKGELEISLKGGKVLQKKLHIYQEIDGKRINVDGRFNIINTKHTTRNPKRHNYGFTVASYDKKHPLFIDPVLSYSTYLGGISSDIGYGIAVDNSGNAYVTGYTGSTDFPILNANQGYISGGDAFVTKLDSNGELVYSTYLGGNNFDEGFGITVDNSGNAYVTGKTKSDDFPTLNAYQGNQPNDDAFVTKLDLNGGLSYSTYLGGGGYDGGKGIAVDATGNAYVIGITHSDDFPLLNEFQGYQGLQAFSDAFVTKLDSNGSLSYSTYLGGDSYETGAGIAVDITGNVYVTGYTSSNNFPVLNANQGYQSGYDVFVTKLDLNGGLSFSTYLGGNNNEIGFGIAVDAFGNAYVTGYTNSTDFPILNANQGYQSGDDAFVTKLDSNGGLSYSTYLGGNDGDIGHGIDVDTSGNAYITGMTRSTDFPTLNEYQGYQSMGDAFVTKLDSGGELSYSTCLGGNDYDDSNGIAVSTSGDVFVTGRTNSIDFPLLNEIQSDQNADDAFVTKFTIGGELDTDGDCLPDNLEVTLGLDPFLTDTDGDGVLDGDEDYDHDGFSNCNELNHGTNLQIQDTDSDGFIDGYENARGTDPNDIASVPAVDLYVDPMVAYGGDGTPGNPFNTIQAALDAALDYNLIQLVDGIYTGIGNKDLNYTGKPLMLASENGAENCIIDCQESGSGFVFQNGEGAISILKGVTIRNGMSHSGGGIYCSNASPTIQNCIITENTAYNQGGGIFLLDTESIIIQNCIIDKNIASYGGGVYFRSFSNSVTFQNCTITQNSAYFMGSGAMLSNGEFIIKNTIFWANTGSQIYTNVSGIVCYSLVQGGWDGEGNIDVDPQLVTDSFRLKSNSPCIDAGSDEYALATDIDDEARWDHPYIVNFTSFIDIGADEFVDTDFDNMADIWEVEHFGDLSHDGSGNSDGDRFNDIDEYENGTNPKDIDSDYDGMTDIWEVIYGLNPNDPTDASKDVDGDMLDNLKEFTIGTNPNNTDSDADGMNDGWEVINGLNPLIDDADIDSDGDGNSNIAEYYCGTNPADNTSFSICGNFLGLYDQRVDTGDDPGANSSRFSQISSDGNGNVYVTWYDSRNGPSDIYFNSSSDYGVTWQGDKRLDTGTRQSSDPQISNDGKGNIYVTWEDNRNGSFDIYFNSSSDYGVTWQGDKRLDTGDTPGANHSDDPQVSSDGNGNVYVTWMDHRNGPKDDIYFNSSSDYGVTWQGDKRLDTGDTPGASSAYNPQISSDGKGNIYVTWEDSRNGSFDIYFNSSSDYGVTWKGDKRLDTGDALGASSAYNPQVSSDGNGNVYVTWMDHRNGPKDDIYFNSSSDYGVTWQGDKRLDTGDAPGASQSTCPQISSDRNGNVYVTWMDIRYGSGFTDIYFNSSSDYGATWQGEKRLDTGDVPGTNWSSYPRISNDGNGNVYVTWKDSRNEPKDDIYFNYSGDYGVTWQGDKRLDTGDAPGASTSSDPQISSDGNGNVYVAWDDRRNGNSDIYFNSFVPILAKGRPTSIDVTPVNPTIVQGEKQQFTATATYPDESTVELTTYTEWVSSNPSVATIDANGLATGISAGSIEITASLGEITSPFSTLTVFNVVDTIAPIITLSGSTPVNVEVGTAYNDEGATASDNVDGNITASIVTGGLPIDTSTPGSHTVTYDVIDSSGNAAVQVTRTVNVTDTEVPVITLSGGTPVDVEVGAAYNDAGATADDNVDGNITASIVTGGLPIDTSALASYTVTYEVTDSSGNAAVQVSRTVNVTDTEVPVITLSGSTPVDVEVGTAYNDEGATASDNVDGNITASIITGGLPIDTSTPGSYIVTYDVIDSSGNAAVQVTRTVNVTDNTIPVITLSGSTPANVEVGTAYNDAGATASDNVDGNITASIVTGGVPIDTSSPGSYIVTYDVTDSSGNAAVQVTRTVNVTDTEVPVITLLGSTPVDVEVGTTYNDEGATASDNVDGNITASIITGGLPIDTSTPGSYIVTYDVTDSSGNAAIQVTRTVNVADSAIPVITLSGSTPVNVEVGAAYNDAGATANDNVDGNISANIVTTGLPIDTSTPGSYIVTYDVTDSSGNAAVQVTRTVNVTDTEVPVITLSGSTPVNVEVGSAYNDAGATASDNVDGNISVNIVTGGLPIDTSTPGSYIVTYDVIDSSGNAAVQVTRTVNVTDTTIPVITLSGSTPVNVEVGTAYNDEGATASDNVDGNITASIVTGGLPIDTSVLGNHTVTYDVTDSSGNAAVQVTRTVNVIDTSSPVAISSVDFEAGWDIWNDGGSDARRSSKDAAYANSGSYCIRLRDNSSTSVMTTDNLDLSTYSEIEVQFSYYCRSMDKTSEDFWLQISTDGGSNFITVEEWNRDDEFVNNERHNETVVISGISLSSNTKLRFRCDASGNQDWVYMDDVIISTR